MKIKGRCLICGKTLREQEVPPECTETYQELTHVFFRYFCSHTLSLADGKFSFDSHVDIFPFCEECEKQVVTKLYQKHSQIQSDLRRIQQVMATSRSQGILCEIIEKHSSLNNVGISSDEETEEEREQAPISASLSRSNNDTDYDYNGDVKLGPKRTEEEVTFAPGIANGGTSDTLGVNKEAVDANNAIANGIISGLSMPPEDSMEELSNSDCSPVPPAYETDSDSSYAVISHSSDEDLTVSGLSDHRNLSGNNQTCEGNPEQLSPPPNSNKPNFEMSDQLNAVICSKQTKAPALAKQQLRQTGPNTFIYLEKFNIERVEGGYKCCDCGLTNVLRSYIMKHILRTHNRGLHPNIIMVEKSPNKWYYSEFMCEKIGGKFSCGTCHYVTTYRKTMREHLRYSHYVVAHPECGPPLTYVCEVCGLVVSRFKTNQHLDTCADEPRFACDDCGEKFYTRGKLLYHRRIHLGEQGKKIMCEHCGRKFYYQHELKDHMFQHTGKRDFICKVCGNSYASSTALSMHSNLHKGRRFDCNVCGAEFTQLYSLTRHKRSHHGINVSRAKGRPTVVEKSG